jgi:hypothetical protein
MNRNEILNEHVVLGKVQDKERVIDYGLHILIILGEVLALVDRLIDHYQFGQ